MSGIEIGGVVMHEGRAREVFYTTQDYLALRSGADISGGAHRSAVAPLHISTKDGWRVHDGTRQPADVGEDDLVEQFYGADLRATCAILARCATWPSIAAYRVTERASPPEPPTITAADLREGDRYRFVVEATVGGGSHANGILFSRSEVAAGTIHLLSRKPAALSVGDKVRNASGATGKILYIDGDTAFVRWACGKATSLELSGLERVS